MQSLESDSKVFKTDITALSDKLGSTFESWAVSFLLREITSISGLVWLSWPILNPLLTFFLTRVISRLCRSIEMRSLFFHVAIRKAESAQRYLNAKMTLENLPPTATDDEYEQAEKLAMAAFCSLVTIRT